MRALAFLRTGLLSLLATTAALAQTPVATPAAPQGQNEIITLPNAKPVRPNAPDPNARQLIESWLDGFILPENTRYDQERYQILDMRRGARGDVMFLGARILPLEGDGLEYAARRCPGRRTPLDIQLYFQWSQSINAWVAHATRGIEMTDPCKGEPLWSKAQVETIVAAPYPPEPPKVRKTDVTTPKAGSPERKAILDALRPAFEAEMKAPVEFKVSMMKVAAGFAFVSVHPQRPGGKEISAADWNASIGPCEYDRREANAQFWMHKHNGVWRIAWGLVGDLCATDAPSAGQGWLVGAPPQLIDEESNGDERGVFPVDDPQFFKLWWLPAAKAD
jgi:hypothetical protein